MEDEFDKKFESELKRLNWGIMNSVTFMYKHGDKKAKKLRPKPGRGEQVTVKIDRRHPHPDGRDLFSYNGHHYRLCVHAEICMGQQNGDYELLICKDKLDMLPLAAALNPLKFRDLLRGVVCFREKFAPYLGGVINLRVECLDDGPENFDVYTSDRNHFTDSIMNSGFGQCLANLLMHIEREYLKDFLDKVLQDKTSAKASKRDRDLEQGMYSLLKQCSDILGDLDILKSVNQVDPVNRQVNCVNCTCFSVPVRVVSKKFDPDKAVNGNIYYITDTDQAYCVSCHTYWDRERRKPTGPHKPPVYSAPEPGAGVERRKRHGISYRFKVAKLMDDRLYRVVRNLTLIEINAVHPEYVKIVRAKGEMSKAARMHARVVAVRALFAEIHRLNPEAKNLQYKESVVLLRAVAQLEVGDDLNGKSVAIDNAVSIAKGMGAKLTIKG